MIVASGIRHKFVMICDFCGGKQGEINLLIASANGTHICDECVSICILAVADNIREREAEVPDGTGSPAPG